MNPETNYVRLRGLPFAAKEQDVRDFLQGLEAKSITFTLTSNGRASGECYVELDDSEAVKEAQKLDRNEIAGRYIEVFTVSDAELSMMVRHGVIKGSGGDAESRYASNFVVRLRGLPYSATIDDIKEFFSGLEVADAVIDKEPGGRPSGEAFVRLASKEHAELALERSKNYMGSRYVEVFRSSAEEMDNSYYAARGIPPPSSGPVPLRGLSPTLDFRFRDRYGDYGRYGGPIRLSSLHPRPSPYDRPYYERDRYYRFGSRYDPEFDDAMYDPAVKVFMRGLPYSVTTLDIEEFFRPLNCVEIKLGYNEERRLSGDALVTFSTMAEAREALSRNKKNMGSRLKRRSRGQRRSRVSEATKVLLRKRRAMKKENRLNEEYAALCKQIRAEMKKDFEEYKQWRKGKGQLERSGNTPDEETMLEDFEREMEEDESLDEKIENEQREKFEQATGEGVHDEGIVNEQRNTGGTPRQDDTIAQECGQQGSAPCQLSSMKTDEEAKNRDVPENERQNDGIALQESNVKSAGIDGIVKLRSDGGTEGSAEKKMQQTRAGPSNSDNLDDWEPLMKGRYIELFPATSIPHPIKTVTFRTVSGAPARLSAAPRPLYSSFAEDEEAAYAGGVGGQQYYNDQYEGRQKYGRDWGEPTRTTW